MCNFNVSYRYVSSFIFSLLLSSGYSQGVKFEKGLTWQQIKEKAKMERKYIFVDCFATWCGPCKQMDKEVYSSEKVGAFLNNKFISIKLQMDTTKQDNEEVKNWYPFAVSFSKQFKVTGFPTYLFFSPDGNIVNKQFGYYKVDDFITIAGNTLNPDKQYYTLLENYQKGRKNYAVMDTLALKAMYLGDIDIANTIARDYINNYLTTLPEKELYTKDNITFISNFINSKEKYFNLFHLHRDKIDEAMNQKRYAQKVIDLSIYSDLVFPIFERSDIKNTQPDWDEISKIIKMNYTEDDAERNVLAAKLKWYPYKQNWPAYCETMIELVNKYKAILTWEELNTYAWDIFLYSNDQAQLNIALNWSTRSIELSLPADSVVTPYLMDTKANILYKLGKYNEAIEQEKKALVLATERKNDVYVKDFKNKLSKMQKGEPTWLTDIKNEE